MGLVNKSMKRQIAAVSFLPTFSYATHKYIVRYRYSNPSTGLEGSRKLRLPNFMTVDI